MANRLAQETSPYLLQHKDNPVDWYPWGAEALARAREQDRPILLSVGYSACHWCHVMERESFEDPETAALHERALRQRQGRPRGAPRRRRPLHGGRAGDQRPGRLADDRLPRPRGSPVLRRHLLPARRQPRDAELPDGDGGGRRRLRAAAATRSASRRRSTRARLAAVAAVEPATASRRDADAARAGARGPARTRRPRARRLRRRAEVPARLGAGAAAGPRRDRPASSRRSTR